MTDTTIEDCGKWGWTLAVDPQGNVVARQPIPYDGVLTYSTEERPVSRRARSEYGLDAREVVRRFHHNADTERSFGDLIDDVQVAFGGVPR